MSDFNAIVDRLPLLGPLPRPVGPTISPSHSADRGPLVRTMPAESFQATLGRQLPQVKAPEAAPLDPQTQREIEKTAKELEALFLRMLLKDMRRPLGKTGEGLFDQSFQTQLQSDMMFEQLADTLAKGKDGPIGIGDMIYEVLSADAHRYAASAESNPTP